MHVRHERRQQRETGREKKRRERGRENQQQIIEKGNSILNMKLSMEQLESDLGMVLGESTAGYLVHTHYVSVQHKGDREEAGGQMTTWKTITKKRQTTNA